MPKLMNHSIDSRIKSVAVYNECVYGVIAEGKECYGCLDVDGGIIRIPLTAITKGQGEFAQKLWWAFSVTADWMADDCIDIPYTKVIKLLATCKDFEELVNSIWAGELVTDDDLLRELGITVPCPFCGKPEKWVRVPHEVNEVCAHCGEW